MPGADVMDDGNSLSDRKKPISLSFETLLWKKGFIALTGIDEAGRGAWAGPVSAGAVILPVDPAVEQQLAGVRDSKQMTARQRYLWAEKIQTAAAAWGVGFASQDEIDALGIIASTRLAMQRAVEHLSLAPDYLLIDALTLPDLLLPQMALIRGDARCLSIAAASILAKTARDRWMTAADEQFPGYGFAAHKGYGTAQHAEALNRFGACLIHRLSFAPVIHAQEKFRNLF